LSRLTTLEIQRTSFFAFYSRLLNHLLCLTPSLLHCIAAEECFDAGFLRPSSTTTAATTEATIAAANNAISEQGAAVLASDLPASGLHESSIVDNHQNNPQASNSAVTTIPVPKIWQCHLLQTLDLRVKWNISTSGLCPETPPLPEADFASTPHDRVAYWTA